MTTPLIKTLFANNIHRRIEEVIKVDQTSEDILRDEIDEYVVTDAIRKHYTQVYDDYWTTFTKPNEGIAIWVSGFFGSGKSSFAKMLGLSIENRDIGGTPAARLFSERAGGPELRSLLSQINEKVKTHAVIFDVSTDRGIRSGNQTLTEIMYGLFLQSLGYAKDLDLSELEITLEEKGQFSLFEETYSKVYGKEWKNEKGKIAFALSEASRVLHHLDPATYPMADSWVKATKNKADITPGKLADRATELMKRRGNNKNLMFVIDEVGQFVARDVQKMLDLQAIVQSLGVRGRGKHWVVVTSQEKLDELVSGLDDKKIELARLKDRFPVQVHLEPSDISEVTSRRVLAKNAVAQKVLAGLFDAHRGRLLESTRLSADIKLPELSRDGFVDLYPLLPYQIDLIIQIVSGLRTRGGASRHVGGANRTIIKLAQQLLINPAVDLSSSPLGALVRLDQVYDLVEGNIDSEVRAKIVGITRVEHHPLAPAVAKVICLLQYVKSVYRTAENIAAALFPHVAAESPLAQVKEALRELEERHYVRHGDDGFRIPTPAEDDWERVRNNIASKPGDRHRLYSEFLAAFFQPTPTFTLFDTKTFKAGLAIHGRDVLDGDTMFHVHFADDANEQKALSNELRVRSQQERKNVFWALGLSDGVAAEAEQLFRSREMLARKSREGRGDSTPGLLREEQIRQKKHEGELRRLLKAACLSGHVYFRGNDRSPSDRAVDVGKSVTEILGQVLPEVFERFKEAAAKPNDVKRGLDALFLAENLQGLPSVFSGLGLLRDEKGKAVFRVESGPLKEVLDRIEERANYGDTASGRFLVEVLGKEPFGWDFEVVRLLLVSLIRAGKVEATSKGQTFDQVSSLDARETFLNNNLFRQASFRPKMGTDFLALAQAAEAFRETFGKDVRELSESAIVQDLRKELVQHDDIVANMVATLSAHRLPGITMLERARDDMKNMVRGSEANAITTLNTTFRPLKDALKRASELTSALTEPRLFVVDRARQVLNVTWPLLAEEADVGADVRAKAALLADLLERETFFRDIPAIEQAARVIEDEYSRRLEEAAAAKETTYQKAVDKLVKTPGWSELSEDLQVSIAEPLVSTKKKQPKATSLALLRSEREACDTRLRAAMRQVQETLEGERLVTLSVQPYFGQGIETVEQLDSALSGLREECARLIGAGKKVVIS